MKVSHSGDVGDVIYALPTIASLVFEKGEPAELWLTPSKGMVREPFTETKLLNVISLFESQPYIKSVHFGERPADALNLDEWRRHYRRRLNLADAVANFCRVKVWDRESPWLSCDFYDEATKGKAVIHRSPRYQTKHFPWRDVVELVKGNAVFVGAPEEHHAFTRQFGEVPYYHTPNLMALARVLAGCRMFFGNQSTPRAIAEGLKKRVYVEEDEWSQNTNFSRETAFYGRRQWKDAMMVYTASFRFE